MQKHRRLRLRGRRRRRCFVLSARERIGAGDRFIASRVFALGVPVVIALNKVDRLKAGHIAQQMNAAARLGELPRAPPGEREDRRRHRRAARRARRAASRRGRSTSRPSSARTSPSRSRSRELVREKALALTRDEVPHAISVEVEELGETFVRANVLVETDSQKQILVGKNGAMVKEIGTRARPEIEALLGQHGLPRAAGQGAAALAPRRDDARAARALAPQRQVGPPASASQRLSASIRAAAAASCRRSVGLGRRVGEQARVARLARALAGVEQQVDAGADRARRGVRRRGGRGSVERVGDDDAAEAELPAEEAARRSAGRTPPATRSGPVRDTTRSRP